MLILPCLLVEELSKGAIRCSQQNKSLRRANIHTKGGILEKDNEIINWTKLDFEAPRSNNRDIELASYKSTN